MNKAVPGVWVTPRLIKINAHALERLVELRLRHARPGAEQQPDLPSHLRRGKARAGFAVFIPFCVDAFHPLPQVRKVHLPVPRGKVRAPAGIVESSNRNRGFEAARVHVQDLLPIVPRCAHQRDSRRNARIHRGSNPFGLCAERHVNYYAPGFALCPPQHILHGLDHCVWRVAAVRPDLRIRAVFVDDGCRKRAVVCPIRIAGDLIAQRANRVHARIQHGKHDVFARVACIVVRPAHLCILFLDAHACFSHPAGYASGAQVFPSIRLT